MVHFVGLAEGICLEPPPMFTFIPCFPHVLASHYEPAQSLDAGVASRSRLKVTEESLQRHPRCRPIERLMVQHSLRVEKHPVYDLGSGEHKGPPALHNASHFFSPPRLSHWRLQSRRRCETHGSVSIRGRRLAVRGVDDAGERVLLVGTRLRGHGGADQLSENQKERWRRSVSWLGCACDETASP